MAAYGASPAGFVVKPTSAILLDMQTAVWATIDSELDLSAQTPDGQMLAIVANELGAAWELIQIAYNQYNREDVEGAGLDNLGDVIGVPREGESFTQVYCTCTLSSGNAPYAAGSLLANISGEPAQTYTNVSPVSAAQITAAGGTPTVLFESTVEGATPTVNAGTLTVITTPVTGWSAITNPAAVPGAGGTLGSNEELDSAYGPRQAAELASEGSCNPSATAAALVALGAAQNPPVTLTVTVIENTTPYQQTVLGVVLASHTYCVVIYDGGAGYASSSPLGNVTTTNGSASITFASNQTLPAGQALAFSAQPGVIYYLASPMAGVTGGTLTQVFTGVGATLPVAIPGSGWIPNAEGQSIGQTIYANKPSGITSVGTTALTIEDPELGQQVVYFSYPTQLPLFVSATVAIRPGSNWSTVAAAIQNALIAAAVAPNQANGYPPPGQFTPGTTVVQSQLEAVIMSVAGVFDVQVLFFGFTSSPASNTPLVLTATQIATLLPTNISNIVLTQGALP